LLQRTTQGLFFHSHQRTQGIARYGFQHQQGALPAEAKRAKVVLRGDSWLKWLSKSKCEDSSFYDATRVFKYFHSWNSNLARCREMPSVYANSDRPFKATIS